MYLQNIVVVHTYAGYDVSPDLLLLPLVDEEIKGNIEKSVWVL